MSANVRQFYDELFRDTSDAVLPDWIWREWSHKDLDALPRIDGGTVKQAAFQIVPKTWLLLRCFQSG